MKSSKERYYILFRNYEHGMALHELLDANHIDNRIAPAPRAIQGELSCGVSLVLDPEVIDAAKACIEENQAEYYDIVPLCGQMVSKRDKYC
ncbi:MAG: DUF3343 domain-containing protein [Lachnospiraceae bacterium]|nr:DUF3343 domain-containing protein [Lachnospiraceae bacterium]